MTGKDFSTTLEMTRGSSLEMTAERMTDGLVAEGLGVVGGVLLLRAAFRNGRIGGGGLAVAEAPPEDDGAGKDEGDGQELSHVQRHAGLEVDLVVLDELDDKAEAEEEDQEDAEDGAPLELRELFGLKPQQRQAEEDITEGLIELRRVVRHTVVIRGVAGEVKAPREIRHGTVNL